MIIGPRILLFLAAMAAVFHSAQSATENTITSFADLPPISAEAYRASVLLDTQNRERQIYKDIEGGLWARMLISASPSIVRAILAETEDDAKVILSIVEYRISYGVLSPNDPLDFDIRVVWRTRCLVRIGRFVADISSPSPLNADQIANLILNIYATVSVDPKPSADAIIRQVKDLIRED